MQSLILEQLAVSVMVGVHNYERQAPQTLLISLVIDTDLSTAMQTDNIADTLDYSALATALQQRLSRKHFQLVEHIAGAICNLLEQEWGCQHYLLTVTKPRALINLKSAQVVVDKRAKTRG